MQPHVIWFKLHKMAQNHYAMMFIKGTLYSSTLHQVNQLIFFFTFMSTISFITFWELDGSHFWKEQDMMVKISCWQKYVFSAFVVTSTIWRGLQGKMSLSSLLGLQHRV